MEDQVLPGDVSAGDLITLPGGTAAVEVRSVRLGQGGFILTVTPRSPPDPGAERTVTLTAAIRLRRHGRVPGS